ncbi:SEC-C metal-binding domain-containing protein [Pseudomonas sp. D(2018)]|uniref:SEC-C metal-binding domain-containing protein n=1 Tax=Pseudomonas sp. D(2018) TaxID=2502238 RepID=UPI001C498413|nr:SEC-C metal-binding domain-containing protein [Pseudomonas sp. D(2018)]
MKKVRRNAPCPCSSGKKYKKCHGDSAHGDRLAQAMAAVPRMHPSQGAKEHQRIEQQGLGKPVLAAKTDSGYQFVAVRNRLFHSKKWRTFHDFLVDYLSHALGMV